MEQIDETGVVGLVLAVQLEQLVDAGLHEDGVVGGGQSEAVLAVPAVLPPPLLRVVHQVVQHQEERLQLRDGEGGSADRDLVSAEVMLPQNDKWFEQNAMTKIAKYLQNYDSCFEG